jgi:sigma-B regulation protein RsbU (phosphoserine phosphatase)
MVVDGDKLETGAPYDAGEFGDTHDAPRTDSTARGAAVAPPVSVLEETLKLLHRVITAAVTSIVVTDPSLPDNPIVFHNPAFERISGYTAREISGRNCRFLQGPLTDPAMLEEMRAAVRAGRACDVTLVNYRKDGTPFWNHVAISPVHDAGGHLTHFVGVHVDVSKRKEAEHERDLLMTQQQRILDTLQRALLLNPLETFTGLEVSSQYAAAWEEEALFGGDFCDVFHVDDHRVALVLGDCTGKGLKAAQYTAEIKYAMRLLLREIANPLPALQRLNNFILSAQRLDERDEGALACVALAVWDTNTGAVSITSAGMEPALVIRGDGGTHVVETEGALIGIDTGVEYRETNVQLAHGDILLMVTDGITEARSPQREFFGYDRLVEIARETSSLGSLELIGQEIVARVLAFAGGKQHDDVCLLMARRPWPTLPA